MKESLVPVAGKIVVKPLDDFATPSGLVLPDSAKRPHSGRVLSIGPNVRESLQGGDKMVYGPKQQLPLEVGCVIVFNYMAGYSFTLKDGGLGEHVEVLDWKDVLAVVEEK